MTHAAVWLRKVVLLLILAVLLLPVPAPARAGVLAAELSAVCVDGVLQIEWDALFQLQGVTYHVAVNGGTVATGLAGSTSVPGTGLMVVEVMAVVANEGSWPMAQEIVTCMPVEEPPAEEGCLFEDGRVNATECAPPVVPFCLPYGIHVYAIDPETGAGSLLMMVRDEVLAAIGIPAENTRLAEANGVILSRLSTGEFQINALDFEGKPYTLVWDDCPPGEVYLIKSLPQASGR